MLKPPIFAASAALLSLLSLTACDFEPFHTKEIAGGYRLYRDDDDFAIFPPGVSAGRPITQLGWRKPFIVADTGEGDWQVFDTSTDHVDEYQGLRPEHIRDDARVRDIALRPARVAWDQLSEDRSQW